MSQALIELQMKFMHQQDEIEILSERLISQGKQIETISIQFKSLKSKLDEITSSNTSPIDEKPPHY